MGKMTHYYAWGNNPVRALYKGKKCWILVGGGKMNSCKIEFENGDTLITSRRALRRLKNERK